MKIKCTYENCFKHFQSKEAMIAHKKKDPDHSYCAKCDVDCDDDMLYFIHQLGSPAHVCCPVCGTEYATTVARDRHLEQQHRASQKLDCAGCQQHFTSAASLMFHIENDECKVIRLTDFQIQRAEKQLEKDAWAREANALELPGEDPDQHLPSHTSTALGLIDDVPSSRRDRTLQSAIGGPISTASLAQFPPLIPAAVSTNTLPSPSATQSAQHGTAFDVLDLNQTTAGLANLQVTVNASNLPDGNTVQADTKVQGWLRTIGPYTNPHEDDGKEVASIYDQKAITSPSSENIPPSIHAADPNPDAKHSHISTRAADSTMSSSAMLDVERFWNASQQEYVCPGGRCQRHFKHAQTFRDHLLSDAHIGGMVVCPSCLKRFATTTAWVSHTESASKKCDIRNSVNFNSVMREITGGVLGSYGFLKDGSVNFVAPKIQDW